MRGRGAGERVEVRQKGGPAPRPTTRGSGWRGVWVRVRQAAGAVATGARELLWAAAGLLPAPAPGWCAASSPAGRPCRQRARLRFGLGQAVGLHGRLARRLAALLRLGFGCQASQQRQPGGHAAQQRLAGRPGQLLQRGQARGAGGKAVRRRRAGGGGGRPLDAARTSSPDTTPIRVPAMRKQKCSSAVYESPSVCSTRRAAASAWPASEGGWAAVRRARTRGRPPLAGSALSAAPPPRKTPLDCADMLCCWVRTSVRESSTELAWGPQAGRSQRRSGVGRCDAAQRAASGRRPGSASTFVHALWTL